MTAIDPVTGQPAALRYEGVHLSFGDTEVLRGLDLVVPRGRITLLAGPSGAGKSVTFRLALGLIEPTAGRIWIGDNDITALRERQRARLRTSFGVVFQHGALFDSMSVFDNVAFPLREHTRGTESEIAQTVEQLLDQVGLASAMQKLPSELSGGMQKRVGLARALAGEPEYLFYDEPTSGLDPMLSASMHQLILDTQRARPELTSFVISHDLQGGLDLVDKVALLLDGRIAHATDPATFRQLPDPRVQDFLRPTVDAGRVPERSAR